MELSAHNWLARLMQSARFFMFALVALGMTALPVTFDLDKKSPTLASAMADDDDGDDDGGDDDGGDDDGDDDDGDDDGDDGGDDDGDDDDDDDDDGDDNR